MRSDGAIGLVVTELRKLLTTRSSRGVLIVMAALGGAVGASAGAFGTDEGPVSTATVFAGLDVVLAIAMPILGVLILASDWQTRDTSSIFLAQPRRSRVFFAKLVTVVLTAAVLLAVAAMLALALAAVLAGGSGRPLDWSGATTATRALVANTVAGAIIGAAAGAAILSVAVGITACFVSLLVLGPILQLAEAPWTDYVSPLAISRYLTGQIGVRPFASAVLLWALLPLGVGYWRNRTREVT